MAIIIGLAVAKIKFTVLSSLAYESFSGGYATKLLTGAFFFKFLCWIYLCHGKFGVLQILFGRELEKIMFFYFVCMMLMIISMATR